MCITQVIIVPSDSPTKFSNICLISPSVHAVFTYHLTLFGIITLTVFFKECINYEISKYISFPVSQLRHSDSITMFSNGRICLLWYERDCRQGMNAGHLRTLESSN
jgi:hypothetical protein